MAWLNDFNRVLYDSCNQLEEYLENHPRFDITRELGIRALDEKGDLAGRRIWLSAFDLVIQDECKTLVLLNHEQHRNRVNYPNHTLEFVLLDIYNALTNKDLFTNILAYIENRFNVEILIAVFSENEAVIGVDEYDVYTDLIPLDYDIPFITALLNNGIVTEHLNLENITAQLNELRNDQEYADQWFIEYMIRTLEGAIRVINEYQ